MEDPPQPSKAQALDAQKPILTACCIRSIRGQKSLGVILWPHLAVSVQHGNDERANALYRVTAESFLLLYHSHYHCLAYNRPNLSPPHHPDQEALPQGSRGLNRPEAESIVPKKFVATKLSDD